MNFVRGMIVFLLVLSPTASGAPDAPARVLGHVVVYEDPKFYCAFPSIVRRADGELLVAFRRAPDRRRFGEPGPTHTDANSYLVLVRSQDDGKTWTQEPQPLYAHPFGGSQDPCMVQLHDGTILCTSYAWARMTAGATAKLKQPVARSGEYVFLGGYVLRSTDAGRTWQGPSVPPPCEGEAHFDIFGDRSRPWTAARCARARTASSTGPSHRTTKSRQAARPFT
jgi:hypothetical protein